MSTPLPGTPAWRLDRLDRLVDALLEGRVDGEVGALMLTIVGLAMATPGLEDEAAAAPPRSRQDAARAARSPKRAMAPASLANLERARAARRTKVEPVEAKVDDVAESGP